MLQERLKMSVIKSCNCPYSNPWYLIKKTIPDKYLLVNITIKLNQVTIKNANLPHLVDKFSKKFADYTLSSFIDFFLGYNQVKLDEESRDLTGFITPLDLIKMTILP